MTFGESFESYKRNKYQNGVSGSVTDQINQLDQQIKNANTRINDAGFNQNIAADDRNSFEKWANLPKGQNWFFDTLEIIGRGGNAVKNVIDKSLISGRETTGDAFVRGLSGREKVSGSDIIKNLGVTGNDLTSKSVRFVGGLATDVFTDPLTYVPGGAIATGAKSAISPVAKLATKSLQTAEDALPILKRLREEKIQPTYEATKDALGSIFNRDYKINQTLAGGTNDFLKDVTQQTENSRRIMQEDTLKNIGEAAKNAGGINTGEQVGRMLEDPLKQTQKQYRLLDGSLTDNEDVIRGMIQGRLNQVRSGSLNNDQLIQTSDEIKKLSSALDNPVETELPRVKRELSTDPKIKSAAETLMNQNQSIRQFAQENGININELEGYMTHVWSQEERALRKNTPKVVKVDQGRFGTANPNGKILNPRQLMGSAEDVNEEIGRKFFEPNAYFASAIGQKRLIDYVHAMKLRREVLSNPDFATKYEQGMLIPKDATVIDVNNYRFIKDSNDILEGVAKQDQIGGQYVVTKAAKRILDRYQKINTDDGINNFLKAMDTVQNGWKRLALFSAGYHIRNIAGAMWNNYASGMDVPSLIKYTTNATEDLRKSILSGSDTALYREFKEQGLGSNNLSAVEFAKAAQEPEQAVMKTVENLSKTTKQKIKSKLNPLNVFETSREVGDFFDQINRLSLYKYSKDQAIKKGLTEEQAIKQAADKVREVQFDYTKLTPTEQQIFARVIPFYRWSRFNIPYQLRAFITDPRRAQRLNYIRMERQDETGIDPQNRPDYMNNNFAIPVTGKGGKGQMLGLNLPIEDLLKTGDPLKLGVDSLSPFIKLPIELGTNYNLYRGKPIEQFKGQEKKYIGDVGIDAKTAYALEQLTGQPGRFLSQSLAQETDKDNQFRQPSFGISSVVKPFDAEQAQYLERIQTLKKLQDFMRYIEQQTGEKPRTVKEINK